VSLRDKTNLPLSDAAPWLGGTQNGVHLIIAFAASYSPCASDIRQLSRGRLMMKRVGKSSESHIIRRWRRWQATFWTLSHGTS